MNNLPRQMLRQILAKYGKEICSDARRCENLLKDFCGSYKREINVLVNAIEERVPLDLLAANQTIPLELLLTRIEKRLEEQTALTAEAARWAVESWALALNLTTDSELKAREVRTRSLPSISDTGAAQPNDSDNKGKNPSLNRTNPFQSPKAQTPVPQPKVYPPVIRQPTKKPLPPVFSPTSNPPAASSTNQPQTINPPTIVKRRFGLFRGCLFIVFLLSIISVLLFLGVPYAIEVMRETQRERNNESPRFPVR
jgi:hypothetical protein